MSMVSDQVEAYIAYKQGLGVTMRSEASVMRQLGRFAASVGHVGPIDVGLAVAWARSGEGHAEGYEIKRYEMARRIHDYSCALAGIPASIPPGLLGKVSNRVTPYIFTDEEVALLMKGAAGLYSQRDRTRAPAYAALIGILRATGMRPSEAMALEDADFDADVGVITVRNGKNSRERMIPLDPSSVEAIGAYRERRDHLRTGRSCTRLLVTAGDQPVSISGFEGAFQEIRCVLLGRGEVWTRRPPRPYDLRHTFAVRTIIGWHEAGADVNALLPVLATYMGHVSVVETYWYLTGTPELVEVASSAFGSFAGGGLPWRL